MKSTNIAPKAFLEQLCKETHSRTETSLRLIFSICEDQEARGSRDFSVAMIGSISAERGGPSPAAIRNKSGEKYRALIAAYADSVGGKKRKSVAPRKNDVDDILEGVTDPVLRTRLGMLLAELASTRAQLLSARHLASKNAVLDLPSDNQQAQPPKAPISALTDQERKTLASAISQKTLDHWGWVIDRSGRVLTDQGQVVFGSGFATAIQKLVE